MSKKSVVHGAIAEAGLAERTRLLGFRPQAKMIEEAHRNHIYLAPSVTGSDGETEGGAPVSIIELMATGMPVVSTLHCDIPNVVLDGQTGFLSPERDWIIWPRPFDGLSVRRRAGAPWEPWRASGWKQSSTRNVQVADSASCTSKQREARTQYPAETEVYTDFRS
jgi:hypothetical protein